MIKVTEPALRKIISLRDEDDSTKESMLRVKVTIGGCSGFSYKLDFTKEVQENDKILGCDGVKIIVDNKSFLYLIGMTLDHDGGLNGRGFIFSNPNATQSCGCGFSFNV